MSKSRNLLALLQVIQKKKSFSVQELADEFHVSYRTMLRYLHELSGLGIPLYSETGKHGGYRLLQDAAVLPAGGRTETSGPVQVVIKPAFRVVGMAYTAPVTSFSAAETLMRILQAQLRNRLGEIPEIRNGNIQYGICKYGPDRFDYWHAVEVSRFDDVPDGMHTLTVPTQRYAVFTHRGATGRAAVDETYAYAVKWLEREGYRQDPRGYHLEVYGERGDLSISHAEINLYLPLH